MATIEERIEEGKALRADVPRSSHADFVRDTSVNPVDLVLSQEEGRLTSLLPVRRERMGESAFAFYRAGALLMATDLAPTPRTGLLAQVCGDAHVSNFGWYGSPERDLVFDTNDFDETMVAAWEWDLKRLAASFVIAAQDNDFGKKNQRRAARASVRSYRDAMAKYASSPILETWYEHVSADQILDRLRSEGRTKHVRRASKFTKKASKKDSRHVLGKIGERVDGQYRIAADPPFVVPVRSDDFPLDAGEVETVVSGVFEHYGASVRPAIRSLVGRFKIIDVALKVVGVGSVGTRCFIAMLEGNGQEDVLFLQIKEAGASVLETEFGDSDLPHHGQRVVEGQRLMQTSSDIMLGWTTSPTGHQYYVRQLKDMKASSDLSKLDPDEMQEYATGCGAVLAHSHARSGDSAMISGYIGSGEVFPEAVTDFAIAYAHQNARDYQAYLDRMLAEASAGPIT